MSLDGKTLCISGGQAAAFLPGPVIRIPFTSAWAMTQACYRKAPMPVISRPTMSVCMVSVPSKV
jgi:hypothetical protein